MPLQMEIYCKELHENNIGEIKDADLKFETEKAKKHKREADEGILEEEAGYFKIVTADVSAGGFMFKSQFTFEAETYMECMLIVDREALPAVAKVIRSRNDDILEAQIVHAAFHKISEPVRDRLIKYLISHQRYSQSKFSKR
jgi:c-di-GMP-binding flagellar brake protein YcgR